MDKTAISLTDFIDVVLKSGVPKATKVRQIKYRRGYSAARDFYKGIREKIIEMHSRKLRFEDLIQFSKTVHIKKRAHYDNIASTYGKWVGNKNVRWVNPPRGLYAGNKIDIRVNPELGLVINNLPHIIKLYFKADELKKNRAVHIYQMMEETLRDTSPASAQMAILDINRSKLFTFSGPDPLVSATIKAELAYIESIWDEV